MGGGCVRLRRLDVESLNRRLLYVRMRGVEMLSDEEEDTEESIEE